MWKMDDRKTTWMEILYSMRYTVQSASFELNLETSIALCKISNVKIFKTPPFPYSTKLHGIHTVLTGQQALTFWQSGKHGNK